MPSGRKRSQPERRQPAFFLDRGLGVNLVAAAIQSRGFEVFPMSAVYPNGTDQLVGDDEWIERASDEDWITRATRSLGGARRLLR